MNLLSLFNKPIYIKKSGSDMFVGVDEINNLNLVNKKSAIPFDGIRGNNVPNSDILDAFISLRIHRSPTFINNMSGYAAISHEPQYFEIVENTLNKKEKEEINRRDVDNIFYKSYKTGRYVNIISHVDNSCLTYRSLSLIFEKCAHNDISQHFDILSNNDEIITYSNFYIKNISDDLFLSFNNSGGSMAVAVEKEYAHAYKISNGYVMDLDAMGVAGDNKNPLPAYESVFVSIGNKLYLGDMERNKTTFYFDKLGDMGYNIKDHKGDCLNYNNDQHDYSFSVCTGHKHQLFEILNSDQKEIVDMPKIAYKSKEGIYIKLPNKLENKTYLGVIDGEIKIVKNKNRALPLTTSLQLDHSFTVKNNKLKLIENDTDIPVKVKIEKNREYDDKINIKVDNSCLMYDEDRDGLITRHCDKSVDQLFEIHEEINSDHTLITDNIQNIKVYKTKILDLNALIVKTEEDRIRDRRIANTVKDVQSSGDYGKINYDLLTVDNVTDNIPKRRYRHHNNKNRKCGEECTIKIIIEYPNNVLDDLLADENIEDTDKNDKITIDNLYTYKKKKKINDQDDTPKVTPFKFMY